MSPGGRQSGAVLDRDGHFCGIFRYYSILIGIDQWTEAMAPDEILFLRNLSK